MIKNQKSAKCQSESESFWDLMIRLFGLSLRLPKLCGGQSCIGQRAERNNGLKKNWDSHNNKTKYF